MKILITGSEGRIGRILTKELSKQHELILLDKNHPSNPVDILTDNITDYFPDINALVHLAANPNPFINEEEAEKNIEIAKRVKEACKQSIFLERIINASSINVYPYLDLYEAGEILTRTTPLSPNTRFGNGGYGRAKIKVEKLFEPYCRNQDISLINLRLGAVTEDDSPPKQSNGRTKPVDRQIHLKHADLIKIINSSLTRNRTGSYVCVSGKRFVDRYLSFSSQ